MKEINLQDELLKRKKFSIPAIQNEFGVGYKDVRSCVREMEKNGRVTLAADGLTYIVESAAPSSQPSRPSDASAQPDAPHHNDESYEEQRARRRREIMAMIAKMSEKDDDEDEDDEEDDEDDDDEDDDEDDEDDKDEKDEKDDESEELRNRLSEYVSQMENLKIIEGVNYSDEMDKAERLVNWLGRGGYKLKIRAIQYGTLSTGYVFDFPPQKADINNLYLFANSIRLAINAEKITLALSRRNDAVYVFARHGARRDFLCKQVLNYFIRQNNGSASIVVAQRGLGIGFNRAGKIMDELADLGCIERPPQSDDVSGRMRVKLNLQDVDILFPELLGWK